MMHCFTLCCVIEIVTRARENRPTELYTIRKKRIESPDLFSLLFHHSYLMSHACAWQTYFFIVLHIFTSTEPHIISCSSKCSLTRLNSLTSPSPYPDNLRYIGIHRSKFLNVCHVIGIQAGLFKWFQPDSCTVRAKDHRFR